MTMISESACPSMTKIGLRLELECQGRVLKSKVCGRKRCGGGVRGKVRGFTRSSRRRMIEKTNRINFQSAFSNSKFRPKFLTLTYGREYPDPKGAKADLRALLKRISRRYPHASAFWRIEFQERGAPHFHLLLFGVPYVAFQLVRMWWEQVIGWNPSCEVIKDVFVRIQEIKGIRQLVYYVAKYCAKEADSSLLDSDTYLAAGRWWGVHNAKELPFDELIESVHRLGFWVWNVRRRALGDKRFSEYEVPGFTYYGDDAAELYRWAMEFISRAAGRAL